MNRHLNHLTKTEQEFINLVYIQLKSFQEASEKLNIGYKDVQKLNSDLSEVWRPITKIRDKWRTKENRDYQESPDKYIKGDFWDFYNWIKTTEDCCHYCGVTQIELDQLHKIGIINFRPTRGKTFEIDRKDPKKPYGDLSNLTYACYWCNNAKTDTFTEEEFMLIGKAISSVWKKRLNNDPR